MTSKVFVFEPTKVDLSPAKDFGEIVYIFRNSRERPPVWDDTLPEIVLAKLDELEYDNQRDYICVAGQVIIIAQALCAIVANIGPVKALLYSAMDQRYASRVLGKEYEPA